MSFVHLRANSSDSIKEGLLNYKKLVDLAVENGHEALALTELNTLSGTLKFQKYAKENGVKPIVGVDLWLDTDLTDPDSEVKTRLLVIAENLEGYRKLMELITKSNHENLKGVKDDKIAFVKQSWLRDMDTSGLIALSGNPTYGEIARLATLEDPKDAGAKTKPALSIYKEMFPNNFFLEISRNAHDKEDIWVQRLVQLSIASKIPVVATQGVLYGSPDDFFSHEVHAAITSKALVLDPEYIPAASRGQHYASSEEMEELFSDLPQAIENANLLAKRCNLDLQLGVNHLPDFEVPKGDTIEKFFIKSCKDGLTERMNDIYPDEKIRQSKEAEYQSRLDEEIGVILDMGFPGYFLVVSDFIRWSKEQGIPVGPGRGSAAGSLVAFCLSITEVDPLEHNLLFERFLNPERVSMPDIDVDFCRDRRDETIQYIFDKYGEESVAQISTKGTMTAKSVVRDVGRTLNMAYLQVDEIARLIPNHVGIKLKEALELEEKLLELYNNDKATKKLIDIALKLEGSTRSIGTHAGGVVISPTKISDFTPSFISEKGVSSTQFDKDDAETAGLIKFDLLGIKTLTLLNEAKKLIDKREEFKDNPLLLNKIPLNDKSALDLLKAGDTYGVFQLESKGITELVKDLQPDNFEDVIALLALYRPGPLNAKMDKQFVERKHGRAEISYYHDSLEDILKPTYGIIIYQEQVMQIAQIIGGYSLGEADLLRRAMGKKKPEEMAKERVKFESGAINNGIDATLAKTLFDLMEKFADYGFNKSHSAAYGMLSIQTASLKAKYPVEFFTAYMNVERDDTSVLNEAIIDARKRGVNLLPPDINKSFTDFTIDSDNCITYGLLSLKGASKKMLDDIVSAREALGDFESFTDFLEKVNNFLRSDGRNAPLRSISEILIRSGAFDKLHPKREELLHYLPQYSDYLGKKNKRQDKDEENGEILLDALWNKIGIKPIPAPIKVTRRKLTPLEAPLWPHADDYQPWNEFQKLDEEAKSVGFYLTSHPMALYEDKLGGLKASLPLSEIENSDISPYDSVLVSGLVSSFRAIMDKNGNKMIFVSLSNGVDVRDVTLFSEACAIHGNKIKVGEFLGLEVNIKDSKRNVGSKEVIAQTVFELPELKSLLATDIDIAIRKEELQDLIDISEKHKGEKMGVVAYMPDGDDRYFRAPLPSIRLNASVECIEEIEQKFGEDRVNISFSSSPNFIPIPKKNSKYDNKKTSFNK